MKGSVFQQAAEQAPEAGFAPVNYGRLTVTPKVKTFGKGEDKHAAPTLTNYKEGQVLDKSQILVMSVLVELREFNPNLDFDYERDVNVQKSGRTKTDWTEIVEPSLVAVFGPNWGDAVMKGPYVEVEDVPNVNGNVSKSGKVIGVPKFLRAFKTKGECAAAREARFGASASGSDGATSDDVPTAVVDQVRGLVKSVGEAKARGMLVDKPFGDYDPDQLIDLAKA